MGEPWILMSLLNPQQDYQIALGEAAKAASARIKIPVRLAYTGDDPAAQIRELDAAAEAPPHARPAAIIVHAAGSVGFERVARRAVEAGIGWVQLSGLGPYLQTLRAGFPRALVSAVFNDGDQIGRLQAQLAIALLPRGGNLLAVEGPTVLASTLHRRRGLEEGLRGGRLPVQKTVTADWTSPGARKAVALALRLWGPRAVRPDAVVAQNDEMAMGAIEGMQDVHPEWKAPPAIGVDGLPGRGMRWIAEGRLAATVVTTNTAGPAVELVARSLRGEAAPPLVTLPLRTHPAIAALR